NLNFVNHKLRVNAGDAFAIYASYADINASIALEGQNLYAGDAGAGTPANSGTVYIGYKGTTPEIGSAPVFVPIDPVRTTAPITGSIGVLPGIIQDTSTPGTDTGETTTITAGLDVTRTLQELFNSSGNITGQQLGSNFRNVKGLAVSPTGQIVVVNTV